MFDGLKHKLSSRLFFSMTTILAVCLLLIYMIVNISFGPSIKNDYIKKSVFLSQQLSKRIDERMNDIENTIVNFIDSYDIKTAIYNSGFNTKLSAQLVNIKSVNPDILGVFILESGEITYSTNSVYKKMLNIITDDITDSRWLITNANKDKTTPVLLYIREISNSEKSKYIVAHVSFEQLFNHNRDKNIFKDYSIVYLKSDEEVFLPIYEDNSKNTSSYKKKLLLLSEETQIIDNKHLYIRQKSEQHSISVITVQKLSITTELSKKLTYFLSGVFILMCILCFICQGNLIKNAFLTPLDTLTDKIHKFVEKETK